MEEIELNFRLDVDGRTSKTHTTSSSGDKNDVDPLGRSNKLAPIDYQSKTVMTSLAHSDDKTFSDHHNFLDDLLFDLQMPSREHRLIEWRARDGFSPPIHSKGCPGVQCWIVAY